MSAFAAGLSRRSGRVGRTVGRFWAGISAVSIKELRGRMRGRRAFVVLTVYLLLLSLFAFAIYVYLKQQAATSGVSFGRDFGGMPFPGGQTLTNGTALSAGIGHGIFGGLLFLETMLILVLAPAFTTGAISLEREKQTLDMLITTPLSTLGMVIGKLFSALIYVFLLILASVPLASLVFVFGGVGPEDLVRAYAFLFALAFGMGAVGLFISAMVRRTQTATVITYVVVLVLSIGTAGAHQFWQVASRQSAGTGSLLISQRAGRAPEALLWLNPFAADLDMVCATAPDTYHLSCEYISGVTGRPYFGSPSPNDTPVQPDFPRSHEGDGVVQPRDLPLLPFAVASEPELVSPGPSQAVSFGFPRDTFWPKSAAAFGVLGVLLTLLAAQLVSPTRRLRLPGRPQLRGRRGSAATDNAPTDNSPTDMPPVETGP
ncbi:hypothetical protein BH24CHL5_BH24CHL5_10450 [soil metagenome]